MSREPRCDGSGDGASGGEVPFVVAVDGPGGVGKSTVSRRLADEIDAAHLDTGAFYRAATLLVLEAGADPSDPDAVESTVVGVEIDQDDGSTFVGDRDVSSAIRSDEVTDAVSEVSSHPNVRRSMVDLQRRWVASRGKRAVVEGRDIGSVVFPDAAVKIYLDADPAVRAARRSGESGGDVTAVGEALQRRDRYDSTRAASPLTRAADAVAIDTTDVDVDAVVAQICDVVAEALAGR